MAEDLWALLDALQEPVPDEVHQHLETVTLNTHFNTSFPSSPAPPPASRPSQLNISQSPEPFTTPTLPAVQDSPAMMLNPGTTPVVAEDESGMCFDYLGKGCCLQHPYNIAMPFCASFSVVWSSCVK